MLRKKRLKCESISARLFLACHQKSNAFKCKQFCCAKPTLAHLLAGGFAPRPRERRAAVHGLCYSVGSSAHSPANALGLERVRARAACVASRPLAFSVSLFHCGAAIGSLFARVYRVVDITFSTLPLQKIKYAAPTNKAAICGSSVSINLFLVVSQKSKPPLCKGRWREAPEGLF